MDNAIMIAAGVFVIALLIAACFASDAKRKEQQTLHDKVPALGPLVVAPKPPARHHVFRLAARNQYTGAISYYCRCGAWYARTPARGWELREQASGLHGWSCTK